jgi:hypothetical protein
VLRKYLFEALARSFTEGKVLGPPHDQCRSVRQAVEVRLDLLEVGGCADSDPATAPGTSRAPLARTAARRRPWGRNRPTRQYTIREDQHPVGPTDDVGDHLAAVLDSHRTSKVGSSRSQGLTGPLTGHHPRGIVAMFQKPVLVDRPG